MRNLACNLACNDDGRERAERFKCSGPTELRKLGAWTEGAGGMYVRASSCPTARLSGGCCNGSTFIS